MSNYVRPTVRPGDAVYLYTPDKSEVYGIEPQHDGVAYVFVRWVDTIDPSPQYAMLVRTDMYHYDFKGNGPTFTSSLSQYVIGEGLHLALLPKNP